MQTEYRHHLRPDGRRIHVMRNESIGRSTSPNLSSPHTVIGKLPIIVAIDIEHLHASINLSNKIPTRSVPMKLVYYYESSKKTRNTAQTLFQNSVRPSTR